MFALYPLEVDPRGGVSPSPSRSLSGSQTFSTCVSRANGHSPASHRLRDWPMGKSTWTKQSCRDSQFMPLNRYLRKRSDPRVAAESTHGLANIIPTAKAHPDPAVPRDGRKLRTRFECDARKGRTPMETSDAKHFNRSWNKNRRQ
jgi:hypothetical protein